MIRYALNEAVLTPSGELFSDLHFGIVCEGGFAGVMQMFNDLVSELYDVSINENDPSARVVRSARGVSDDGFIIVYQIQRLGI